MSFKAKTDYCGLVAATTVSGSAKLAVRSANENKSSNSYAPAGESGAIIDIEAYGEDATPANEYALLADLNATAGMIQIGKVTNIGTSPSSKSYRLSSVKISTAVNTPVKVSASAQLVQSGSTDVATQNFDVPSFDLDTKHLAQDIFSAFTVTGGNLIACDADISAKISTDTLVGNIVSNGAGEGLITVSGTILVSASAEPTIEESSGWTLTKPLTCDNPETAYRQYTFEVQKKLALHTSGAL